MPSPDIVPRSAVPRKCRRPRGAQYAAIVAAVARPWPDICVNHVGHTRGGGYGSVKVAGRRTSAHRLAYELAYGPVPAGLLVCHRCKQNRACINPGHLYAGTPAENSADMVRDGTVATGDRHGTRTHPEKRIWSDHNAHRLHPEIISRGSSHGMAKLSEPDVLVIRYRVGVGDNPRLVAIDYGVSRALIGMIAQRKLWRHVPPAEQE